VATIDRTYVLRSGLAKGLKKRGGLGLSQRLRPARRFNEEDAFLQRLDFAGKTIFDIGGFLGIHTIFFASRAGPQGRVVTFEPDPINYRHILRNVEVNGFENVMVRNVGVGERPGKLEFAYPSDRGRGTANPKGLERYKRDHPDAALVTLPVTSVDAFLRSGEAPPPDFLKIDVEGLELAVLEGMTETAANYKPAIFVELHGWGSEDKQANSARVLRWLHGQGYEVLHVESGQSIASKGPQLAREGHLYCV
jgi:FkbM family methyltransferase